MRRTGGRQTHLDSAPEKKRLGTKGKSSSLEGGSQTDVRDCGRVVVGHFPGRASSKACSAVSSKYSERENLRRSPRWQSQCQGLSANTKLRKRETRSISERRPFEISLGQMTCVDQFRREDLLRSGWKEGPRECSWFPFKETLFKED